MSYVTKLGAYGLAGVAAFAVALAVLLSASSTPTAQAAEIPVTSGTATVQPGDTAVMTQDGRIVRFTIDGENSTSTGSFASGGGQTIACSDDGSCDTGVTDDDPPVDVEDSIQVKLDVDSDSADGFIIVKYAVVIDALGAVGDAANAGTIVITVTTQPKPDTLTAKPDSTSVAASDDAGNTDETTITATVKNDQDPSEGVEGETLTFITTLGLLDCDGAGNDAPSQVCQADTEEDDNSTDVNELGTATVMLIGGGRAGTATITVTHGSVDPASVEVTFYGDAGDLTAAAEQDSVHIGGKVFVVLTVTDDAGNAVKGQTPIVTTGDKGIVGPTDDSNEVKTSALANKLSKGKVAIPACEAHEGTEADPSTETEAVAGSSGTNDDGQCVVEVSAPADDADTSDDEAATRGVNTLNFELGTGADKLTASVEIEVAGVPATIATDPADGSYVGHLSETTITITVTDDEEVLAGATNVRVRKLEGGGLVEGDATDAITEAKPNGGTLTKNGVATVTFTAPSRDGVVTLVIDAGKGTGSIRTALTLNIGTEPEPVEPEVVEPVEPEVVEPVEPEVVEPVVEPEPVVEVVTPPGIVGFNPSAGQSGVVTFTDLTSIDDALGLIGCGDQTGATVSLTLMDGSSAIYAVGAPAFANRGFTDNVEFPIALTGAYVSCP